MGGWFDPQSEEIRKAVKENIEEIKNNTGELKKFNLTSTILAGAMIFIGIVQIFITLVKK